jgi:hypothetical protein
VHAVGGRFLSQVDVLVKVDTQGKVIDARVIENRGNADTAPALEAARNWRFRPQSFDGKPVIAVGSVSIYVSPPEDKADPHAAVPQSDPADTEITLARTACFGNCPDYQVSVRGDGLVRFDTRSEGRGTVGDVHLEFQGMGVLVPARHEAHIDPAAAQALIARFRTAGFFGLKTEYSASVTDMPTYFLVYRAGKNIRKLTDYAGVGVGMPDAITDLEDAIDTVSGSDRWVKGNVDTVAWLASMHFDFRSKAATGLALAVLQNARYVHDDDTPRVFAMIVAMADRGMSLDTGGVGAGLASLAAVKGNEALFEQLRRKGFVAKMKKADLDQAFGSGAGCSGPIARALLAAGANPKAQSDGFGGNALHALRGDMGGVCEGRDSARIADAARAMVAAHVPIEGRDGIGWTPLMGVEYPEVAQALIAGGANLNAHDHDGTPALLSSSDDRVVLTMLRAGADLHARDKTGTVRDMARRSHMPATLGWLDAHAM